MSDRLCATLGAFEAFLTISTMSNPHLPAELLDHIVDLLHDTEYALRNCCLISKAWIPRTRKHLFAEITFYTEEDLQSWKKTFSDPLTSPARYVKSLSVRRPAVVTAADREPGGWITGFSRVVHLEVDCYQLLYHEFVGSFVPFHGLSSVVKSLRLYFIYLLSSKITDLILSFPLLEDLTMAAYAKVVTWRDGGSDATSTAIGPSSSPPFTGSLRLTLPGGIKPIAIRLLSLPSGIHFKKLNLRCRKEDLPLTMGLVEGCSHTLESLDITCISRCKLAFICVHTNHSILFLAQSRSASIDLSKATGLKDTAFRGEPQTLGWIAMALQTITPKHRDLRQILIDVYYPDVGIDVRKTIGEVACVQWSELDHILVQFWESRSIRPRAIWTPLGEEKENTWKRDCIGCLLPEVMRRGIIDLT